MAEIGFKVKGRLAQGYGHHAVAGDEVWLTWTDRLGGWYNWEWRGERYAKLFASPDEALLAARGCDGPWFYLPSPDTIEVVEGVFTPARPPRFEVS